MASQLRVELSGPLFTKPITRTVRGAQNKLVQRVTAKGRENVRKRLVKGHGRESGAFRRSVRGRTKRGVGVVASRNPMIAAWLEDGGQRFSRRTSFRGYHIFRDAAEETDRTAGAEARRLGREIARQLGGR